MQESEDAAIERFKMYSQSVSKSVARVGGDDDISYLWVGIMCLEVLHFLEVVLDVLELVLTGLWAKGALGPGNCKQ